MRVYICEAESNEREEIKLKILRWCNIEKNDTTGGHPLGFARPDIGWLFGFSTPALAAYGQHIYIYIYVFVFNFLLLMAVHR